ncbi:SpvB/TcaC N-terminal domain-containing protein [Pseudomonas sp. NFACC05-1]|uniref:SpvB/TcaC N-terminal domain-containing protein n=1 Tax=Pseudomonas sp. NFACC05-1 TaxID=1566241 RepID=UPI000871927D|nr:SpvB/TcaC N-terminal domain-containing protein [Pseudomonas sp. NFACC05-1]SCW81965.1 Insecticide toxin TcdB middle/C-terminal region [Pseudomonas sp. NFACC05-1]
MSEHSTMPVNAPSLPKGGGAIQSIGKGWSAIGAHGTASYEIALPISPGRGFAPSLSLGYASSAGNGVFGIGWGLSLPCVARWTAQGVPAYTEEDEIIGPGAVVWLPERDPQGAIRSTRIDRYNRLALNKTYTVIRYFPRIESRFERIEYWSSDKETPGFWLVHDADGSLHVFGKSPSARRADPLDSRRVGEWLLEESLNAHGEHILYQYKADVTAQRYLSRVCYGNFKADADLYLWEADRLKAVQWHFELVFDYGERSTEYQRKPNYEGHQWLARDDAFSSFAYGFELRTERLCRQVLMFHRFPDEWGAAPVLVRRVLLDYRQTSLGYHQLTAAHDQAFGDSTTADHRPPVEFSYSEFKFPLERPDWQPWQNMPGLNKNQGFQLVDLYGEGLPGVLHRGDGGWYYREPMRAKANSNEVAYGQWRALPRIPVADPAKPLQQSLSDLTGDGRLDWIIAQPGWSGFFSLGPERNWSDFATFNAFPAEFFNPQGQLADLMGAGLSDLVLIGPRSVRVYANQQENGFSAAREISRGEADDALPLLSASPSELVAFSDMLGSGQQHLVRIRHNEVKCWPNLGHGRFGNGIVLGSPGLAYETFDASHIRLADLDGSGATDLLYLQADQALIFMNRGGNGFSPPVALPWPQGLHYDRLCQVSIADLQGLGCSSLVLSLPHRGNQHWRYDFVSAKPYLLTGTNNNMGAANSIRYRSSAQEWLDEKAERMAADRPLACHLPLVVHVVSNQTQLDEITGNRLLQSFTYRQGYYDGIEREFRGFGLLLQTDEQTNPDDAESPGFTTPCLTKNWFHTGQAVDLPRIGYSHADPIAVAPGKTLLSQYLPETGSDTPIVSPTTATILEMSRALSGYLLRSEVFGVDTRQGSRTLYSVQENRYRIRLLQAPEGNRRHARMLPLLLESIHYQYEGLTDDPQCQHTFNLQYDAYGSLTHSVNVHYARRKTLDDTPPFSDADQQRWWRDAHDPAQQFHYLTETCAEYIHLPAPQGWRLGLPYRQRTHALKKPKAPETGGLSTRDMTYERFIELTGETAWITQSVLTGLSVQRYKDASTAETLPDGVAHFEALGAHMETAELDETALKAFHLLPQTSRPKGKLLERIGYHRMDAFLPATPLLDKLWSVKRDFATYAPLEGFYKIQTQQASEHHGVTAFSYDNYHCFITAFKLPDGCVTQALYDYRSLLPRRITDPNGNVQEGLVDAFGQVLATTFYGTENNTPVGFKPIAQFKRLCFDSSTEAIEQRQDALQEAATALCYTPFSWMGCVSNAALADGDWLARCVLNRDLLPSGHIRASARTRLGDLQTLCADDLKLKNEMDAATREPVHLAALVADRYPDDDQQQIRIAITCFDGFGRTLQSKQRVEPGMAYVVTSQGALALKDEKPMEQTTATRWRVSERVEYNNKGLPIRLYRPYFADQHRYINDESLRQFGHCDQQFYDALGRPTRTRLATQAGLSYMRRHSRHAWYTLDEDENDTLEEVMAEQAPVIGGEA